ncbi:MAG TPA: metallopeptidase TldD-related protein [Mycobacteriales bacterium]|jgi:predicted Zn-dependent protease|nr:metallopeptidase TldD-related protein [Mycobacteriales bacterium]
MSELVERVLALSRADGCVVVLRESRGADLRWAGNTLTTNGARAQRSLAVVSVVGDSVGATSASSVDDLESLVRASEQAARDAGPAEDAGPLVEGRASADFAEPAEAASPRVFDAFARELGEAFGGARADGIRLYGYASHDVTTTWLGSSSGLRLRHAEPTGYVELTGKGDAPGASTWVGQHTRDWTDVAVPALDADVRRRLAWAQRQVDLPAGRYETLLPPSAVADLLVYAYWTAAGRDAAEGRTVFSRPGGGTRVGDRIGPAGLRMRSDPAYSGAPFAVTTASSSVTSVFDNGLPLTATDWLSDGVLTALVQTRATATAAGVPVTPYVHNLDVDGGGTATLDEMVAGTTGRGLLLTSLWYIREVDAPTLLLTGLTRDGVYLVEDGEVVGAVNNFRFNESPVDLLGRVTEVGRTQECLPRELSDYFTWTRMPSLRVPDFNMSSVSQAF